MSVRGTSTLLNNALLSAHYERCGLLEKPARTGGNYRLYSDAQLEQLGFILNCRNLDMTHEEIRRLLKLRHRPPRDCTDVNALIDEHIVHIEERIAQLRQLSRNLRQLRTSCNEVRSLEDCTIIGILRRPASFGGNAGPQAEVHRRGHSGRTKRA